jgi:hypothetical protein
MDFHPANYSGPDDESLDLNWNSGLSRKIPGKKILI